MYNHSAKFNPEDIQHYLSGLWLTDLSQISSYVFNHMSGVNWAGFYLDDGISLKLGPFCGKPACLEIKYNNGVCGKAFNTQQTLNVPDVDLFPNHIRCDTETRSELVIPFYVNKKIVGVFDIDSSEVNRFSASEVKSLENILSIASANLNFTLGCAIMKSSIA
jgi:L-methionine (R)-S-oxide reductase